MKSPHPRNLKHFPLMMGVLINWSIRFCKYLEAKKLQRDVWWVPHPQEIWTDGNDDIWEQWWVGKVAYRCSGTAILKIPASDSRRVDLAFHSPFLCKWAMRTMFEATCMQDTPDTSRLEDTARVLFFLTCVCYAKDRHPQLCCKDVQIHGVLVGSLPELWQES